MRARTSSFIGPDRRAASPGRDLLTDSRQSVQHPISEWNIFFKMTTHASPFDLISNDLKPQKASAYPPLRPSLYPAFD